MNETPPLELSPEPASEPMPVLARMMNVFAVPGEVFANVKHSPNSPASWLLPILVASVVGMVAAVILFSQETIIHEVREAQAKAMQQQVEKGTLTQAQADEAMTMIEKFSSPTIMKISGSVGAIVVSFVRVFWWAFALWLLALLLLRVRMPYLKVLEVTGLASLIGTLGILVKLLLQINLGRTSATPSLALAVTEFDPSNKLHLVLGAVNLVQIWMVVVMGVGLARLTNIPLTRAILLVVAFYFLQTSALIMLGAGMAMM
jgi:hypothetical protein